MSAKILQFAEFELDRTAYQLRRKGRVVRLERIPLDLLLFLVERRGQLVTREEIRKQIWGADVFLDTESSINTAIRKLRRVLRDRPGSPRFIETVPLKGYRFIAAAHEPASQAIPNRQSEIAFAKDASKTTPLYGSQTGERRHLTVLVCELTNSTGLAAQPDPEEWWENLANYHRAAVQAIERYGGRVGPYRSDAMVAYFSWPSAHDNDAERAARAGLEIIEAIARLNEHSSRPKVSGRVGIDSGMVLVRAGAGKDIDVFGDVPNIAAQVQSSAEPDTVAITAATQRLVSGLFIVETKGAQRLKGVTSTIEHFRVVRSTGIKGRLGATRRLTPFMGREEELGLLLSRWQRTREGEGQVALIIGEPGIGKSRLVAEFHDRIRDTPHIWMESAGEQIFESTPFHAIIKMLSRWLELRDAANTDEQCERLERAFASARLKVAEVAPLIADLLQLPTGERYPALTMTGEQKRRRLLAALIGWVLGAARLQPLVMAVEDHHWLDPSTLELLQLLTEQGATVPLMLLYTARPEFHSPWPMRTHHSHITLKRLSSRHVREMVASMTTSDPVASETVEAVIERAVGVPLFVEELTRAVLEGGGPQATDRQIPATLRDSLMARLDRLASAQQILQIGAVIGTRFSYELLRAVHSLPDEDLQTALRSAAEAELVYVRGIPPDATYEFKHALIHDTAYDALLRSRRKELHSRVAEVLVAQFPNRITSTPELLAHHYTEAGLTEQAIPYWQQAGQRAFERSANTEAITHFTKGLELLKSIPDSIERSQQELELQIALVASLMIIKGYAAPDAGKSLARALELCRVVGETPRRFPVLASLTGFYLVRSELSTARELAGELLQLADNLQTPALLQFAHYMAGTVSYFSGNFPESRKHLERAITLYGPQSRGLSVILDPGVGCRAVTGITLWVLGYPDQALKRIRESLTLAQELSHPLSLAYAFNYTAALHQLRREVELTQEHSEALIRLAREYGFTLWEGLGVTLRGWSLAKQGRSEEGIAQIRQGQAATQATGAEVWQPHFLGRLAEACWGSAQPEEGLAALTAALDMTSRTGESYYYEAELYRLKGELLLMLSDFYTAQAESCFQRAIQVAREQSAKSWELRATTSLARLLADQGRRDEARSMLAEIYGWFTEGFDTADLKEAKGLLEKLSGSPAW